MIDDLGNALQFEKLVFGEGCSGNFSSTPKVGT